MRSPHGVGLLPRCVYVTPRRHTSELATRSLQTHCFTRAQDMVCPVHTERLALGLWIQGGRTAGVSPSRYSGKSTICNANVSRHSTSATPLTQLAGARSRASTVCVSTTEISGRHCVCDADHGCAGGCAAAGGCRVRRRGCGGRCGGGGGVGGGEHRGGRCIARHVRCATPHAEGLFRFLHFGDPDRDRGSTLVFSF